MLGRWLLRQGQRWLRRWRLRRGDPDAIPEALWQRTVRALPPLQALAPGERHRLRGLSAAFLARKRFSGAHGLVVDDGKALLVAAQACLPLLHRGLPALAWYDGFVGIVLHPHEVRAPRRLTDEAGVVHEYEEELAGEAMQGGPLVLAWPHVLGATAGPTVGHNLVIHEFAHVIDMHGKPLGQPADGCPLLPAGWLGMSAAQARALWRAELHAAFEEHRRRVVMHEHFGAPAPWLDAYGARAPEEFFAVSLEAYCVDRAQLAAQHPRWTALLDALLAHPGAPASAAQLPPAVSAAAAP